MCALSHVVSNDFGRSGLSLWVKYFVSLHFTFKFRRINCQCYTKRKCKGKGKAVSLQARRGPEGSRKLKFPDFVTTAQDGGMVSALLIGRLYPQEILWYSFLMEAESTPGP
jgi:hypothetical protein